MMGRRDERRRDRGRRACARPTASREAVRGIDFAVAPRRGLRPARAQRRRQDDDRRDPRGLPRRAAAATSRCSGYDPGDAAGELRERVGIVLQSCGIYPHLTVREAVAHWAALYPAPRDVDEVIELAGLEEAADRRTRTLSGGQQRRLDFALALVGDPELVFLDEPTTGFDPAARRARVGDRPLAARPRQDRAADHPLPRRGAGARRPRGDHQGRARSSPRARRASWASARRATASPGATAARPSSARPTTRPRCCTSSRRAALARGERARGPERDAADPRGRLPGADRRVSDHALDGHADAPRAPRAPRRVAARRLAPVPARAPDVLAQPERGVLQLPAAAAVPRAVRRDLRRRAGRDLDVIVPGHRRHERDVDDVHRRSPTTSRSCASRGSSSACAARRCRRRPTWRASPATRSPTRWSRWRS